MCLSYEETDGRNEDVDERDGGIRRLCHHLYPVLGLRQSLSGTVRGDQRLASVVVLACCDGGACPAAAPLCPQDG